MKFTQAHRSALHSAMGEQDLSPDNFEYVKRRGRINIIHIASKKTFAYLRRKETKIDPKTHQWIESQHFQVSRNNRQEIIEENWDRVLGQFKDWLLELN